jgi:hypothetical protein
MLPLLLSLQLPLLLPLLLLALLPLLLLLSTSVLQLLWLLLSPSVKHSLQLLPLVGARLLVAPPRPRALPAASAPPRVRLPS